MRTVDGIVLGAVMLIVAIAAFFAVRRKKRGSCCGDCCACSEKGHCRDSQDQG